MAKSCEYCGKRSYGQYCMAHKPRKPIQTHSKPTQRTFIKKTGKHAYLWRKARTEWLKQNYAEYYSCYLCGRVISINAMQLDHVESRVRRPDLRYEQSNLKPACRTCNRLKGSMSLDEFNKFKQSIKSI